MKATASTKVDVVTRLAMFLRSSGRLRMCCALLRLSSPKLGIGQSTSKKNKQVRERKTQTG